jgi:hypothetical protein
LHPSDPITEVRGIPDENSLPTVLNNYQSTFTVSPAIGATGTWSFELALIPHPIGFVWVHITDSTGNRYVVYNNSQIPGVTHADKIHLFRRFAQRWRVAYMGLSCHQDGPDLANQGTIVAAQAPVQAHKYKWCNVGPTGGDGYKPMYAHPDIAVFEEYDMPSFETCQSMPNAYFNNSKFGCYMPLKLTRTAQNWRSGASDIFMGTGVVAETGTQLDLGFLALPHLSTVSTFPFPDLEVAGYDSVVSAFFGITTSDFLNDNWGHIAARNLAVTTSFTFFVRQGLEMQVLPGTSLTPQQKLPPAHDPLALEAYFRIARELSDAYPVDYNDLGQIWDVISNVAKTVAPALAAIPGVGMPLSAAVSGAANLGDMVKATIARVKNAGNGSNGNGSSAGDRDLAKTIVEKAATTVAPTKPLIRAIAVKPLTGKALRRARKRVAKKK